MKVNIPLLKGKVPSGWIVSLVDNPGFGEAQEHIEQIADSSLLISSAYFYLLETGSIGGKEAAGFYNELYRRDSSISFHTSKLLRNIVLFHADIKPEHSTKSFLLSVN